jgi:hypothetical protein
LTISCEVVVAVCTSSTNSHAAACRVCVHFPFCFCCPLCSPYHKPTSRLASRLSFNLATQHFPHLNISTSVPPPILALAFGSYPCTVNHVSLFSINCETQKMKLSSPWKESAHWKRRSCKLPHLLELITPILLWRCFSRSRTWNFWGVRCGGTILVDPPLPRHIQTRLRARLTTESNVHKYVCPVSANVWATSLPISKRDLIRAYHRFITQCRTKFQRAFNSRKGTSRPPIMNGGKCLATAWGLPS